MVAVAGDVLGRFRSDKACGKVAAVAESDQGWRREVPSGDGDRIAGERLGPVFAVGRS